MIIAITKFTLEIKLPEPHFVIRPIKLSTLYYVDG